MAHTISDAAQSILSSYDLLYKVSTTSWGPGTGLTRNQYFKKCPDMVAPYSKAVIATAEAITSFRDAMQKDESVGLAVDKAMKAKYGSKIQSWDSGRYYCMAALLESAAALNHFLENGTTDGYDSQAVFANKYGIEKNNHEVYMQGKEESEPFWSSWFSGFGVGPLVILAGIAIVGVLVGGTVVASVYISKEAEKSMKAMEENTKVLEATFKMQQELSKAVEKQAEAVLDACKANKYSPEECKSMMDSLYQWGTTQGVLINQAALQSMKATGAAVGSGYSPEAAAPGFFASLGSGLKWGLILAGVGAGSIAAVKLYKTIKE